MRVVLYQPNFTGHHLAYLARMLPGFLKLPVDTVIATSQEALDSQEYQKTLKPFESQVTIEACCQMPPAKPLANARHRLREARRVAQQFNADHLCIMHGEGIWLLSALCGLIRRPFPKNLPIETWIYRGDFAEPHVQSLKSKLKKLLFCLLLKKNTFAAIHLDHEFLYDYAAQAANDTQTRLFLTPNPIEIRPLLSLQEARQQLSLPLDGRLMVCSGTITARKGADLLLQAFVEHRKKPQHQQDRLLLAGPFDDHIQNLIHNKYQTLVDSQTLICINGFLDSREMYLCAAAGDLTVAPYPHYSGRSSIIFWAAAAGRPCLGTQDSCVGYVIEKENLGLICDVTNEQAFNHQLAKAMNMTWTEQDQQRVRRYAQFHSMENYQRVGTTLLREQYQK